MNVWLITIGEELPTDPGARKARTALLADRLVAKGHRVLWWTSAFDHFRKAWAFSADTEVPLGERYGLRVLKGTGYRRNISPARFLDHRVLAAKFRRAVRNDPGPRPDIVVAAIPSYDLAREAVRFGRRQGIPVVVDIRDQWPEIFLDPVPGPLKGVARLALRREFSLFGEAVRGAAGLTAMMDSLLAWGLGYAGRDAGWRDRVFYLGFDRRKTAESEPSARIVEMLKPLRDRFVATFFGTFGYYHDPSVLLESAERLRGERIHFVIAGDGELMPRIRARAEHLPNVTLPGWLNQNEIATLLRYSHAGVCPASRDAAFFPNKAFVYLSEGLPVLSAFRGDLKRFIETHEVGFHFAPNDGEALAGALRSLEGSPALRQRLSENARRVYDELLDADRIYDGYVTHLERMVGS